MHRMMFSYLMPLLSISIYHQPDTFSTITDSVVNQDPMQKKEGLAIADGGVVFYYSVLLPNYIFKQ